MSRLGDLIKLERGRRNLTAKQVARKVGVSESYLLAVEAGTKIIADDQARRILKAMGMQQQTEADFSLDDIAATVDLQSASEEMQRAQATQRKIAKARPEAENDLAGRAEQRAQARAGVQRRHEGSGPSSAAGGERQD